MKTLLLTLTLLALPSTALAVADQCFEDDYAALPTTNCGVDVCQSEVNTYYQYLSDNPLIVDAIDYCDGAGTSPNLPQAVRDALWQKFEYAQANPSEGTAPVADWADYTSRVGYGVRFACCLEEEEYGGRIIYGTLAELIDSYSSKVAHAVWVDVADFFPWKLSQYDEQNLRYLLDPEEIWQTNPTPERYTRGGAGYADFTTPDVGGNYVESFAAVDHSPRDAWLFAYGSTVGDAKSPRTAAQRIMHRLGETRHHSGCDAKFSLTIREFWSSENNRKRSYELGNPASPSDPCYIDPGSLPSDTKYTARSGCNDRAVATMALMRAVNIPTYYITGTAGGSSGHSAFVLPTLNFATDHADRGVYGGLHEEGVAPTVLTEYDFGTYSRPYQEPSHNTMGRLSCFEPQTLGSRKRWTSLVRQAQCQAPSYWDKHNSSLNFCGLGFQYWRDTFCRTSADVDANDWHLFSQCEAQWFVDAQARMSVIYGCSGNP